MKRSPPLQLLSMAVCRGIGRQRSGHPLWLSPFTTKLLQDKRSSLIQSLAMPASDDSIIDESTLINFKKTKL